MSKYSSRDGKLSLSKLVGKRIVDVSVWADQPEGFGEPVYIPFRILFEDGTFLFIAAEGEAYIDSNQSFRNMDEDTIRSLIEED